jgi:uncharacterized protein YndB with AHSA1/START domain
MEKKVALSAEMLIRKPAAEVFNAFVDPRIIEKFWLKSASGPLEKGAKVDWEFMVPGARDTITVTEIIPDKVIGWRWSDGTAVELGFHHHERTATRISVTDSAFGDGNELSHALDAMQGFTIVLCDLKCLLETGQSGNMVRDKAALITADKARAKDSS